MSYSPPTDHQDVEIKEVKVVSHQFGTLAQTTFAHRRRDGEWQTQQRETYDRGNGTAILPYDRERATVLLTRQFRYPAFLNGHPDGMLIEAAAGVIDPGEDPATTIRRETCEELGLRVTELEHVLDAFVSPGAATERQHLFAAPYTPASRTGDGGGLAREGEDIEALELPFATALAMAGDGRIIDLKTITLLQWAALHGPFAKP